MNGSYVLGRSDTHGSQFKAYKMATYDDVNHAMVR